jgi:EXPERA (EXPanded EBP superfamily)
MSQRENMKTGQEYAKADKRWGTADPTIVSMELLTVFGAGTLGVWIVYQIVKRNPVRYYWIVVLSTAELYGGYVSFFFWLFGLPGGS